MPRTGSKLSGLLFLAAALAVTSVRGADPRLAVIVSRDRPTLALDRATLRDIYLKKIVVDERGRPLVPVNLPPEHPLRRAFSLGVLHASGEQLQSYWNERYFHGVRPPYVLGSQNAVLQFVARTAGAVGYVVSCRVDATVQEVLSLPLSGSQLDEARRLCDSAARS